MKEDGKPQDASTPTFLGDSHTSPYGSFALRDINSVEEFVDPRLTPASRPTPSELDESIPQHIAHAFQHYSHSHSHPHIHNQNHVQEKSEGSGDQDQQDSDVEKKAGVSTQRDSSCETAEEVFYIDWEKGDKRNPANFSYARKWTITIVACALTGFSASTASTYAMGYDSMIRDLNTTTFKATIGLSLYACGFGIVPLVTAPLTEEFGRLPLYIVSTVIFDLMHLGIALSQNIHQVQIFRFLMGAAGSTGATMVGGTIADIWGPEERGIPMSVFGVAAIGGTGLGPVVAGWIEMNRKLEWRWIQWLEFITTSVFFVVMLFTLSETRSSVLLTRMARKLRKDTGDHRYRARIEDERGSLRNLLVISCTRPVHLLIREPVVTSFSLWIGFAWGVLYALIESITPAFRELHNFNIGEIGTVFVTMFIGSILGFFTNLYQEKIYRAKFPEKRQEARLYAACLAGVIFPIGMFIYAWTSLAHVHWIGMAIGITLFIWACFVMYLAVFTYLADCYGPFASSALAGQSLCRNLMGTAFPLFTQQMYRNLTFPWASTLFAFIAVLMMPIPFILFKWGPQIRARSKFAKMVPSFGS